ncbi:hypothetical protein D9611_013798 [Ephemerocybe angulata]|uniref:Uncharacterized protein n=1 Tax=Ephemerocybe angulata TaxID=980116 RepID=A0A8H5C3B4_9AGAR|nr:hypothetical protein D9611_013798 [Tulosesus angulatus]
MPSPPRSTIHALFLSAAVPVAPLKSDDGSRRQQAACAALNRQVGSFTYPPTSRHHFRHNHPDAVFRRRIEERQRFCRSRPFRRRIEERRWLWTLPEWPASGLREGAHLLSPYPAAHIPYRQPATTRRYSPPQVALWSLDTIQHHTTALSEREL